MHMTRCLSYGLQAEFTHTSSHRRRQNKPHIKKREEWGNDRQKAAGPLGGVLRRFVVWCGGEKAHHQIPSLSQKEQHQAPQYLPEHSLTFISAAVTKAQT